MWFAALRRMFWASRSSKGGTKTLPPKDIIPIIQCQSTQLRDLPTELVLQILSELPASSVLAFALTCHALHILSVPALYDSVIICKEDERRFRARVAGHDPCLSFIHHVQLGRPERRSPSDHWTFVGIGSLLSALPRLRTVKTVGEVYLYDWDGVFTLGTSIGASLLNLTATVHVSRTRTTPAAVRPVYAALQSLDLTFVQKNDVQVPYTPSPLQRGFPNLVHLRIVHVYRYIGVPTQLPIFTFFAKSYFPHLQTFSLITDRGFGRVCLPLREEEYSAVVTFLAKHFNILTVLALPSWPLPNSRSRQGSGLDSIPLTLRKLRAGQQLIAQLSDATRHHTGLQVLQVDYPVACYDDYEEYRTAQLIALHHDMLELHVNDLPPPSSARIVRLTLELYQMVRYGDVAAAFPEVEELHLDLFFSSTTTPAGGPHFTWTEDTQTMLARCPRLKRVLIHGDGLGPHIYELRDGGFVRTVDEMQRHRNAYYWEQLAMVGTLFSASP